MTFPDLTNKIKVNNKPLLEEKKENFIEENINIKKDDEKLSAYVAILLSKIEKEKLEKIAKENERSVSYMIRKAIKEIYKI